jgi:hypothetical protein
VHWQQDIVVFLCEVLEHELKVADGVRSECRTAIVAPNKARETADA